MPTRSGTDLVWLALAFYLPMGAGLFFLKPSGLLRVEDWAGFAAGMGVALVAGVTVVGLSRLTARSTVWGSRLRAEFRKILGGMGPREVLMLALLSAFGEEILFRGVIHPRLGLFPTAILFGFFHFPIRRWMIPWSLFALALGLVLGLLTDQFRSLWPVIFLHFFINYFNLNDLAGDGPEPD